MLVVGAAVSGRAAAMLGRDRGHDVIVYDQAEAAIDGLAEFGFSLAHGEWDAALLDGIDVVVTSPGVPEHAAPLVDAEKAHTVVWSELEFGSRHLGTPYVAVTGTNGKTTVTTTTASMLTESGINAIVAGNIGTPVSSIVDADVDAVVIEASSFQLRYIDTFHPTAAAILNIAPDHLDWHGSHVAYVAAKARITENMGGDDLLVYDIDDPGAAAMAAASGLMTIPVSGTSVPDHGAGTVGSSLVIGDNRYPMPTTDPSYAVDLGIAAVLAGKEGATAQAIGRTITDFEPGPHRREVVGEWGGVTWVDDSKATNPHAARAAASSYQSVILIAGGRNKGLDLGGMVAPTVRRVVAYGEAGPEIASAAAVPGVVVRSFDDAVTEAARAAQPGDVVLLAPGCASFDQFGSYTERGERFALLARRVARVGK